MFLASGLVTFGATSLLDEDGRPVAEIASPHYPRVPTEVVACPYADVRAGAPMNRSALRQMSAVWPELLGAFSALAGPAPTVSRAWAAAVTGIALPLVAPRPVPRLTAGLFKASLGLSQVFSALLLTAEGVADTPLLGLGDGEAFFAALDQGRWLVGDEQVCAGTRPMIVAAFDALTGGSAPCPPEIAAGIARVGSVPPEVVGLHVAHLAAVQAAARAGDGDPITSTQAPWMRAVAAIPNRPPEHALRLFPAGRAPASLQRYLAATTRDRATLEAAFAAEIGRLDEATVGPRAL